MMRNLLILWSALLVAAAAPAQILTLEQAIALALESSHEARSQRLRLLESEQDVLAARGRFKTQLALVIDAPNLNESVQGANIPGQLPQYTTYGSSEWSAGLSLVQPLPTDGRIQLSGDVSHRTDSVFDDTTTDTRRSRTLFNRYRVSLTQPLFVPNSLQLSLERARLNLAESRRNYTAAQLDMVYNVTAEFFAFLRAERSLEIAEAEVAQQEAASQLARRKFEAGLIPEVESLQMEVDLAQSRNGLLAADGARARAADRFKNVVGVPMDAVVSVTADTEPAFYEVDPLLAVRHALVHRTEIRAIETRRRRAEITVAETDARSAVKGELRAYYDLTGIGTSTDYRDPRELWDLSWEDIRRRPGSKGFVFMLSVPLWDSGVNRAEVAAARAALARSDLDGEQQQRVIIMQVNAALIALAESRARLEALARSVEVAMRSLEISRQRFDNGDITSQELALDRDRLTSARLAYLDAFIQFQLAGADLKRQTLYDFERGRSLVGDEEAS
jgi:outer membrane protein TolC